MGIISGLLENTNDILYLGKFLFHLVEYFQSSSSHESNVHQKAHGEQAFLHGITKAITLSFVRSGIAPICVADSVTAVWT